MEYTKEIKKQDIISVVIATTKSTPVFTLVKEERKAFIREFLQILKRKPIRGLRSPESARIGPDYKIIITLKDGSRKEYNIYSRAVLRDMETNEMRHFYMGLLIYERLEEIPPR